MTASTASYRIMDSDILEPINLGSSEMVSVNQLVDIVEDIAGVKLKRSYDLSAPKGVVGRNSENTLIQKLLNWEPSISLRAGLEKTYAWIYDEYMAREKIIAAGHGFRATMSLANYFAESIAVLERARQSWTENLVARAIETITSALRCGQTRAGLRQRRVRRGCHAHHRRAGGPVSGGP